MSIALSCWPPRWPEASSLGMVPTLAIGARSALGLAAGACIPLAIAIIGDRFPLEQRQLALSRYLLAVIVGPSSPAAPLSGILSEMIGWRPVFGIARRHRLHRRAGRAHDDPAARQHRTSAVQCSNDHSHFQQRFSGIRWRSTAISRSRSKGSSSTAFRPTSRRCWRSGARAACVRPASSSPASDSAA